MTLSGSASLWAGGTVTGTYTVGEGLGNLLIGPGAQSVGGVANGSNSFTLEVRQDLSDRLNVGVAVGHEEYDVVTNLNTVTSPNVGLTGGFDELTTVHLNAFYSPTEALTYAFENIYQESSGPLASANADRFGASVTLRF